MSHHRFKVGQVVDFTTLAGVTVLAREYKILRLLASEGSEPLYRIKTITEPVERVARESELSLGDAIVAGSNLIGLPMNGDMLNSFSTGGNTWSGSLSLAPQTYSIVPLGDGASAILYCRTN